MPAIKVFEWIFLLAIVISLPLRIVHSFDFLSFFSRYKDTKISGTARPIPYMNNNMPPVYTEPVVAANNKIATKIGPTHGLQEMAKAAPNKNAPR